jgi:regulator of sigma E protease
MELFETVLITIATLAVLITIHEYGHFWVARRCGIKVLRFSIGFGKKLFGWRDSQGTEYVIAAIPLGGYVKMLDEREGDVPDDQLNQAFNRKPLKHRMATVAAGPIANLLLAIGVYWFVFISGVSGIAPLVDSIEPGSVAEMAGLEQGQEIVAVDGIDTPTWESLHLALLDRIGESGPITFSVKYPDSGVVYESEGVLQEWLAGEETTDLVAALGIHLYRPMVLSIIEKVMPDSPAERSGLKAGDKILTADGLGMSQWADWVDYVRVRPEQTISLIFQRDDQQLITELVPAAKVDEQGKQFGQVGVVVQWPEWPEDLRRSYQYGPMEALAAAAERTWSMSLFTLDAIKKMLSGLISPKNLSGPITIAKVASASANSGLEAYLGFFALLSVSLGVLNLLPIPVLDGGHLMYGLIEALTRRPVPEKVQVLGYQVGLMIIVGVMMLALYNDITRL